MIEPCPFCGIAPGDGLAMLHPNTDCPLNGLATTWELWNHRPGEEALLKALKDVVDEIGEKIIEVEAQYKRAFANVDEGKGMVTGLKIARIFVEALLKEHGR